MKCFIWVLLCCTAICSSFAGPELHCENPKFDFGTLIGQDEITHEFVVWNRGDETLEIIKVKNCCGVKTVVDLMSIPPGSNTVCRSVFTTKNRSGQQDKQILLVTNDKKNLYYDLRLTGTLRNSVEFNPRFVKLSNLLPDSCISEIITATNLSDQAMVLESVSTTVPGLEAEIVPQQQDESGVEGVDPVRGWNIQLKSVGPLTAGKLSGQIQLKFSNATMTVPVHGTVKPVILATPERIQLSSKSSKAVKRLVMLRSGDERAFEVLSASLQHATGEVESKKLSDGKWRINLLVEPNSIQPKAAVFIETTAGEEPIKIPITLGR